VTRDPTTGAYTLVGVSVWFTFDASTNTCTTPGKSLNGFVSIAQNYDWIAATVKK
jgi:hypothetical protein